MRVRALNQMRMRKFTLLLVAALLSCGAYAQKPKAAPRGLKLHALEQNAGVRRAPLIPGGGLPIDTVTTTLPAGKITTTYFTGQYFDDSMASTFGSSMAWGELNLHPTTWLEASGDTVWMETPLQVGRSLGYLHGTLSNGGRVLTFNMPQPVLDIKTETGKATFYAAVCDSNGFAGDTLRRSFTRNAMTYYLTDDGVWVPVDNYLLGLFATDDLAVGYAYTSTPEYFTKQFIDSRSKKYRYTYNNIKTNNTAGEAVATVVDEGDGYYVKGFVPKYPDAWVFFYHREGMDSLMAYSGQIVDMSSDLGNTYFFASSKEDGDSMALYSALLARYDSVSRQLTIGDSEAYSTLWFPDYQEGYSTPQHYSQAVLTYWDLKVAKPATPSEFAYHTRSNSVEVKFTLTPTDVDGNAIDVTSAYYRMYVDDQPYAFTKAGYPRMKSDTTMTLVPWLFDDYYTVSKSGDVRYVELQGLPSDTKTLGVEVVYSVGGETRVSDRLTYDIATGQSAVTGIEAVRPAGESVHAVSRYTLGGQRVSTPRRGLNIVRMSDGTTRKVLVR